MTAITPLVRKYLDDERAEVASVRVETMDHAAGTPSSGGLRRVSGTTTCGRPWSFVVKSIHSARHWPHIDSVPEPFRTEFIGEFPWRTEADVYTAGLPMPAGLRLPRLFLVEDLGDDRLDLWLEDVRPAPGEWDLTRYAGAARGLGRLAGLRPAGGPQTDTALRIYVTKRIMNHAVPALLEPAVWRHPLVASHADPLLQMDLDALARHIPALLAAAASLPHTMAHGDASPQNLMVPVDAPGEFVAIDWGWQDPVPIGFDLGQLLVGLAHLGATEPGELPVIHRTIQEAYTRGLADEGVAGDHVAAGYVTTLVLRSAFTAIPVERLGEPVTDGLQDLFRKRVGLARFIADLGLAL
ncbi:aminoglycoside phosphotransferase family protein [Nonomuraea sp. NBC_00507]|uniref:phosphotransferase n=1 Tax=Nonomuraea sp. NBC_00507 TaxID=2976002 RepID=UPI002E1875C5